MNSSVSPIVPTEHRGIKFLLNVRKDPLAFFTRLMHKFSRFTWIELKGHKVFVPFDATAVEHILKRNAANYLKSPFTHTLDPLLGRGIFLSDGALWKKQRQESAMVFANGNFPEMTQQMVAATEAMFVRWDKAIEKEQPIDITLETMAFALDVLLRALFHEERDGVAGKVQEVLGILLRDAENRIWSVVNFPQKLLYKFPKYKSAIGFLNDMVNELTEARRNNKAYPNDLLSRLIESYGETPDERKILSDQIMSYLLAGHETTSHGLSWSMYLLGSHPYYAQKLAEEADVVLNGKAPDYEKAKQLKYSKQVFSEALRLYPPVWTISRQADKDDIIPLDNGETVHLPSRACVMVCDYAIHRSDKYWDNPAVFDPERFSATEIERRHPFAWLPFGGGDRLCLGFKFAEIESVVALSMIAQRYSFQLVAGQKILPKPIITLRPDGPILFNIRKRGEERVRPQHTVQHPLPITNTEAAPSRCPFHRKDDVAA